ncbi:hypothetical protein BU23DRAFT_597899 [Bimuria novae-zelandiae CBS 107.79]|uniref:Zn(2)-C6 fungal-type domain-containing protein n=1 Tax=Bimuria novae-zelandiae CBS 107.79 TaxID=1447943 RepID=A0A6A5VF72_9PLEO|nr:hypothetical protein BU23DRAFT_597899 [Bimuria novae-zelandiae CBS 107.79]
MTYSRLSFVSPSTPPPVPTSMQEQVPRDQARPTVACLRCREQKLKCGRELPSCERCRKQSALCTYPSPPDRKQIAQKTRRTKASQPGSEKRLQNSLSPSATTNPAKRRCTSPAAPTPFHCLAEPEAAELPSTEIGLLLQEVFYKRVYNSTLLTHRTVSFQVYMLKKMPEYVQRSIFAIAAIFLQEVDSPYHKYLKLLPMQTIHQKSWAWAHAASVEVLSHVDEPSVLKIGALQNLQLYYFSRGEIIRAKVHASLAYQLSRLLGYNKLQEPENSPPNSGLRFDREIRRRSFWASWCTMCLGSDNLSSEQLLASAVGLPLPARFEPGGSIQGVDLTLGQQLTPEWTPRTDDKQPNSLMAELVRLLGIWTKVRAWVSHSRSLPISERLRELMRLDGLLEAVEQSMQLPIIDLSASAESPDESPELLVSFCSVYHLSRLLLPAFEVLVIEDRPLLLGEATDTPAGVCSGVVYAQAVAFTELLKQFIAKNLDITRLWPFTGYAAFMVGHVFLNMYTAMLQPPDESKNGVAGAHGPDSEEIKVLQTVLEVLSIYWRPLQTLAANLQEAVDTARSADGISSGTRAFPWEYINFFTESDLMSHSVQTNHQQHGESHIQTSVDEEETPQSGSGVQPSAFESLMSGHE